MGKLPSKALFIILFGGLLAGGLRDPLAWSVAGALLWMTAMAFPKAGGELKWWTPWLLWAAASALLSSQPLKCFLPWTRWLGVIVFFCMIRVSWGARERETWFKGYCLAGLALALAALFLTGTDSAGVWGALKGDGHAMTGLIPPHYNYTIFALAGLAAALAAYLGHPRRKGGGPAWALAGLLVLILAVIFLSRSRGGLLAALSGTALWQWRKGGGRLVLIGGGLVLLLAALGPMRLDHFLKLETLGAYKRPQIWLSALAVAGERPLLGEGIGNFEAGFLRHNFPSGLPSRFGFATEHAHSEVLELPAATGWAGLALFLAGLLGAGRWPKRAKTDAHQEAALCAAAAMSVHLAVDNMLHLPGLGMLYFSALACALDPPGGSQPPERQESPQGLWAAFWPMVCLAGLGLSLVSWIPESIAGRARGAAPAESDPSRRLEVAQRAVRVFPADAYLRELLARAWVIQEPPLPDKAFSEILTASRLSPFNAIYPAMLADLSLGRGQPEKALAHLGRATRLEPNFMVARLMRAEINLKRGRPGYVRRELEEISSRRSLIGGAGLRGYDGFILRFDEARYAGLEERLAELEAKGVKAPRRGRRGRR